MMNQSPSLKFWIQSLLSTSTSLSLYSLLLSLNALAPSTERICRLPLGTRLLLLFSLNSFHLLLTLLSLLFTYLVLLSSFCWNCIPLLLLISLRLLSLLIIFPSYESSYNSLLFSLSYIDSTSYLSLYYTMLLLSLFLSTSPLLLSLPLIVSTLLILSSNDSLHSPTLISTLSHYYSSYFFKPSFLYFFFLLHVQSLQIILLSHPFFSNSSSPMPLTHYIY